MVQERDDHGHAAGVDPDATTDSRPPGQGGALALESGTRLGIYEILDPLGAGAMGEVYRARDTRLDRDVAIKVLPPDFASDDTRLRRFEREAKSLATLNHQNIAQIYGVDEVDGTHFLSLELVPGENLDDRLARGPMGIEEALRVARHMAEGLEAAHEAGVIHRDLKPANVRVTPDGVAKILDFGLAKPVSTTHGSTTLSALTLDQGHLVGTPTYMAPEQIDGRAIDRRVDVWAFGCVLYECLTGKRAFDGENLGTLFAAIATRTVDLHRIAAAPAPVQRLVERCLRKDPRSRLRDIGDARVVLEDVLAGRDAAVGRAPGTPARMATRVLLGLVAGIALGGFAVWSLAPRSAERPPIGRYSIALPAQPSPLLLDAPAGRAPPLTIAPDGSSVVFSARGEDRVLRLYQRFADTGEIRMLPGTQTAESPFFAPDGAKVGFLRHGIQGTGWIALADGALRSMQQIQPTRGSEWSPDGEIVYASSHDEQGLWTAPGGAGKPVLLTTPAADELDHRWPQVIEGGDRVLFTARMKDRFEPRILDRESGDIVRVDAQVGLCMRYLPGPHEPGRGFLVYNRLEDLWAVRFDLATAQLVGDPMLVVQRVHVSVLGVPHFAVSDQGLLVYEPHRPPSPGRGLVWKPRDGEETPVHAGMGYEFPRLSPDGSKILFANHTTAATHDIWTLEWERNAPVKVTTGENYVEPIWSPGGDRIIFSHYGVKNLYMQTLAASSDAVPLLERPGWQLPLQWVTENQVLYHELRTKTGWDLMLLDLADLSVHTVLATRDTERAGRVSPDGRWLAYVSDETGRLQVYLRSYPDVGAKQAVTLEGGDEPVWSPTPVEGGGRELFFRRGRSMWVVHIPDSEDDRIGTPEKLFDGKYVGGFSGRPNYDVTADGKRFIMVDEGYGLTAGRLDIRFDFAHELEATLPKADR